MKKCAISGFEKDMIVTYANIFRNEIFLNYREFYCNT